MKYALRDYKFNLSQVSASFIYIKTFLLLQDPLHSTIPLSQSYIVQNIFLLHKCSIHANLSLTILSHL